LQLSDSLSINPLAMVYRENKDRRICIDARKMNNIMLPDWARAPPIEEMVQQFHGVKYTTSLDLNQRFYRSHWKQVPGNIPLSYLILMSINFRGYLSERNIRWQLLCEV